MFLPHATCGCCCPCHCQVNVGKHDAGFEVILPVYIYLPIFVCTRLQKWFRSQ